MREIKFRGRLNSGLCVYGGLVKISEKHSYIIGYFGNPKYSAEEDLLDVKCVCHKVKNETIGQYTGLKDKNNVQIFEGDILADSVGDSFSVFYNCAHCAFMAKYVKTKRDEKKQGYFRLGDCCSLSIEVIGNIYDNPELLEGE